MTKLHKWVLIEAGHDEDEHDIDVGVLKVLDNKKDAKKALKEQVEKDQQERWGGYEDEDFEGDEIGWNDDETEVTITSGDGCDNWCKKYKVEKI